MMRAWFRNAKLGIFLHWGIYAVNGIPESWSFYRGQISHEDYLKQCEGFTAAKYDPDAWADLFERAGARYAVLTAKHHDGVALWDTNVSDLSIPKRTPAGRDLIGPYCEALRRRALRVGIYYSHLDWSHPDYPTIRPTHRPVDESNPGHRFSYPPADRDDPAGWERFLEFHRAQLRELCEGYQPDLMWFDGNWERDDEQWRFDELTVQLQTWRPGLVVNGRMGSNPPYGDYQTPEQGIPIHPPRGPWEFCVTMNRSWGFQPHDTEYKSARQIIRMFAEVIGMGGNLLLAVGPKEDGTLPPEQVERLEALGDWIGRHEEAVYPTGAGLPHGHYYGASTLSLDRRTLYLFQFDRPHESIAVKGLHNAVERITVLGDGRELTHRKMGGAPWAHVPGVLWIDLPEAALDSHCTVVKVELDGPLNLYTGGGRAIEQN